MSRFSDFKPPSHRPTLHPSFWKSFKWPKIKWAMAKGIKRVNELANPPFPEEPKPFDVQLLDKGGKPYHRPSYGENKFKPSATRDSDMLIQTGKEK